MPITPKKKQQPIPVKNAGMVLLNSYYQMLFDRLGLLGDDKNFKSQTQQLQAVHYLQYLVSGLSNAEEYLLPLNKVMCGLPLATTVPDGIEITPEHKQLMDGLIKAAIGYWPAIGEYSIEGIRGNWLVRNGLLLEKEDRWELTAEKRAYDILIHKSPFTFSIIKQSWMDKPIHVMWPY
jgi:Contractile injection system tape measure protein